MTTAAAARPHPQAPRHDHRARGRPAAAAAWSHGRSTESLGYTDDSEIAATD